MACLTSLLENLRKGGARFFLKICDWIARSVASCAEIIARRVTERKFEKSFMSVAKRSSISLLDSNLQARSHPVLCLSSPSFF